MNILITGGTGFIGTHLCRKLLEEKHFVICLDNNFTGKTENILDLLENPNFIFIEHDIIYPINLDSYNIDQIYHLACPASPKAYQYDTISYIWLFYYNNYQIKLLFERKVQGHSRKARAVGHKRKQGWGKPVRTRFEPR